MKNGFLCLLQIFPTSDIVKSAKFYEGLGFRASYYLDAAEPHICLYRDQIEIVLTQSNKDRISPNREQHGYGYDAYFITDLQKEIYDELVEAGVNIVRPLVTTDYGNREFVFEDVDGRWIAVGKKQNV